MNCDVFNKLIDKPWRNSSPCKPGDVSKSVLGTFSAPAETKASQEDWSSFSYGNGHIRFSGLLLWQSLRTESVV